MPPFHHVLDHRDVENPVERIDDALNAAAAGEVDDGILRHVEEITGNHHIRAAEVDDAVAVGVRGFGMRHDDAFAVDEVELLLVAEIRLAGDERRLPGLAQPQGHVLVRDHLRAGTRVIDVPNAIGAARG